MAKKKKDKKMLRAARSSKAAVVTARRERPLSTQRAREAIEAHRGLARSSPSSRGSSFCRQKQFAAAALKATLRPSDTVLS